MIPIAPDQESSSNMDSEVSTTTITINSTASLNLTMTEDMVFNAGHQLSIIVYRFVPKIQSATAVKRTDFCYFCLFSQYFNGYIGNRKYNCVSFTN